MKHIEDAAKELLHAVDNNRLSDPLAMRAITAACFADQASAEVGRCAEAPRALLRTMLIALIDPLDERLDYLRKDPARGAAARAERDLVAASSADAAKWLSGEGKK